MPMIVSGWTWRRAALGAAALAVAVGGGFGVNALTAKATAAPAPVKLAGAHATADNDDQAKKAWLGLMIAQLNDRLAQRLGISQTSGVVIVDVPNDGPGAAAGVQRGDVLLKVNGTDVPDMKAAREAIAQVAPGDSVTLTVSRGGNEQTITVTAAERPAPPKAPKPPMKPLPPALGLGLGLPQLKELEGIPPAEMFAHMQGGTMTFTDKDGQPVTVTVTLGKVTAVDTAASSVTVQPNAGGSPVTYTVGPDTQIHGRARELVQLKADDKVAVMTVNGSSEARSIMAAPEFRRGAAHPLRPGRGDEPKAGARFEVRPLFDGMGMMGMEEPLRFAMFSPADHLAGLADELAEIEVIAAERAVTY